MAEHLPECRVRTYTTDDGMVYEVAGDLCICPALRACERRLRKEERALICVEQTALSELNAEYRKGVQAARDAASNQRSKFKARDWDDAIDAAIAAIDALAVDR